MRGRFMALALSVLLVFQLTLPPVRATDYVYFVAAGENIMPMSAATMPFWHGGYLYISSDIFTGIARKALNIGRSRRNTDKLIVLYSGAKSLWFCWEEDYGYDLDGNTYRPGAIYRKGEVFVPVSIVAQYFGLQYTVTRLSRLINGELVQGDLAWIRKPGSVLSDQEFADAASSPIADCYLAYLKEKEETAAKLPEASNGVEMQGKSIYLCLTAKADTGAILNELDRHEAQAAFFCTPDFLESQGELLRRMAATGQTVGLLVDGADESRTVPEQLEVGNRALEQATCGKTRLAMVRNGDEADLAAAVQAGYRCLEPRLDRSAYSLRGKTAAESLLKKISAQRGGVSVWLADTADVAGIRAFLNAVDRQEGRCRAWTETA